VGIKVVDTHWSVLPLPAARLLPLPQIYCPAADDTADATVLLLPLMHCSRCHADLLPLTLQELIPLSCAKIFLMCSSDCLVI
jgi:hypothetical protein